MKKKYLDMSALAFVAIWVLFGCGHFHYRE